MGTWAVGNKKDYNQFVDEIEKIKEKYYRIIGDDDLFNGLDHSITRALDIMNTLEGRYESSPNVMR